MVHIFINMESTRVSVSARTSGEARKAIQKVAPGEWFYEGRISEEKESVHRRRIQYLKQSQTSRHNHIPANINQWVDARGGWNKGTSAPLVECKYCKRSVPYHTVNRWHNENCKSKPTQQ